MHEAGEIRSQNRCYLNKGEAGSGETPSKILFPLSFEGER